MQARCGHFGYGERELTTIQVCTRAPVARRHCGKTISMMCVSAAKDRENVGADLDLGWTTYIVAMIDGDDRVADITLSLRFRGRTEDWT